MGTVLVVDDSPELCKVVARLFRAAGHHASCALDGPSALRMLEADAFEAVVLDVSMPGMDGFAVLERMQADPKLSELPVVMYTAIAEAGAAKRALDLGAREVVPKRGNWQELYSHVSPHLSS
jgi:putative two-component system response regulator